jgi:cytochrome P450/NADPH-cytochrome P450 reductase
VIALLLQNFDFELADPDYHLSVQRTLTVKPKGLFIRATLRDNLTPATLQRRLLGGQATLAKRETLETVQKVARLESALQDPDLKNLVICYGSNTGTCQTLAHALSREARTHGFRAVTMPMDSAQDRITPSTPIIIITASYEGEPPDNAVQFVNWLERLTDSPFTGVSHAVYGCGNRDWVDTFQRIPTLVDDAFIRCGSSPLVKRGISDAADSNIFNEFDRWADVKLWPALEKQYRPSVSLQNEGIRDIGIDIIQSRRSAGMLPGGGQAVVQEERVLTATGEPQKRHIKIRLPEGMTYRAGDHLAILPANHHNTVRDVMNRFGLVHDTKMIVGNGDEHSVYTFLRDYVELNHVATEKVRTVSCHCKAKSILSILARTSAPSLHQYHRSI